ncbi:hypothetical protein QOT17_006602 [Balamuthia mandrillaris]
MERLPNELLLTVLGWAGVEDLVSAQRVCSWWRDCLGCADLWRVCYFNSFAPPLAGSAVPLETKEASDPVHWKKVALERLSLIYSADPEVNLKKVATTLRSAAQRADPQDEPTNRDKKRKTKPPEEVIQEYTGPKRPLLFARTKCADRDQVAEVNELIGEASSMLVFIDRVLLLRRSLKRLSANSWRRHSLARKAATSKQAKLLNMLSDNFHYEKLYSDTEDIGDYTMKVTRKGTIVMYSLVTGLPLRLYFRNWAIHRHQQQSTLYWQSLAGPKVEGRVCWVHREKEREQREFKKLQGFLFGEDNADVLNPSLMQLFLETALIFEGGETHLYWEACPKRRNEFLSYVCLCQKLSRRKDK